MRDNKLSTIPYVILLLAGFLSLCCTRLLSYGYIYGCSTFAFLIIFMILVNCTETRKQLVITGAVFVIGYIIKFYGVIGIPVADVIFIAALATLIYFVFILYRVITSIFENILTTLLFPCLWMLVYCIMTIIRIPSVMRVDMYFFDMKFFLQSEHLITSYGLSFAILWISSLAAYSIYRKSLVAAIIWAIIAGLIIGFGVVKLNEAEKPESYVKVASAVGPYVGDALNYKVLSYEECVDSFDKSVEEAAEMGADIIAFNEETYEIEDKYEDKFIEHAEDEAFANNIHILVGFDVNDTDGDLGGKSKNEIYWIDNEGDALGVYEKHQTIPVLEASYERGETDLSSYVIDIDGKKVKVAFAICYDSNFPLYMSKIKDDADILFLPSWDWKGVTAIHYRICGNLAVQNDMAMVKPTYDGYSIATDAYGRVLSLTNTDETGYESVRIIDVPIMKGGDR